MLQVEKSMKAKSLLHCMYVAMLVLYSKREPTWQPCNLLNFITLDVIFTISIFVSFARKRFVISTKLIIYSSIFAGTMPCVPLTGAIPKVS